MQTKIREVASGRGGLTRRARFSFLISRALAFSLEASMSMMRIYQHSGSAQFQATHEPRTQLMRRIMRSLLFLAVFALTASAATAQSTSLLNGRVSDPSGAAVPGATITLTGVDTGFHRSTTSNSEGLYQFLEVPPGNYKLEAAAKGFSLYTVTSLRLVVNTPSTINIALQLTGVSTSVTVEETGGALINRTDASLGNSIGQDQIEELPIPDRNVVELLSLQPGVAYLGEKLESSATDSRSGAVNGMRSDQSNVTLDDIGVNDQNNGYAFTSILTVPPDSVQEFRVTTADANADAGYSSGAQVGLVTKSGTNSFHGSAYEYNRNTIFSANDPFLKTSQGLDGDSNTAPKLLRNVFGATVGGPVKHDKLFFFLNYEGRRDAEGTSVLRIVPSANFRNGSLSYDIAQSISPSVPPPPGVCPDSSMVAGVPVCTLSETQLNPMDPAGIGVDQNVLTLLQQYPMPNDPTAGDTLNTQGYRFSSNADSSFNTYIARIDYHIDSHGSETLFWRGQTQNDKQPQAQQFPGQSAASTLLDDSKGSTVGLTSIISSTLINDFHWGFIRQGGQSAGASLQPEVILNGIDSITPFTRSLIYIVPVNQFSDSLNWTHGNHTFQFGTDIFRIRNNQTSYQDAFSDAQTNVVYLDTSGLSEPGNPSPLNPANNPTSSGAVHYPTVDGNFAPNYDNAAAIYYGILAEGDGIYNFDHAGNPLAQGTPIARHWAINDYEFFGQDSWRITPRLTVTYGLRWVLEAPPYETGGLQVSPCVQATGGGCTNLNTADWYNTSAKLAAEGMPANGAGEISFILGGPVNNGPGLWNWDRHDFSPRIAVAWAPDTGEGWLSKILGQKDKFSIRGGYNIVYDHFGIPIVNSFDQHGSFGLSTDIGDSAGVPSVLAAPRFTCDTCLPAPCPVLAGPSCLFGPAPTGGFPVTPSNSEFAINWGLDQSVKTPYAHVFNLSLSRQITPGSSLQISYVGTIARRLPMQMDLAAPINYVDPASGTTYFQAAKMLSVVAENKTPTSQVQPIPFFENTFPAWSSVTANQLNNEPNGSENCSPGNPSGGSSLGSGASLTATQAIYDLWTCNAHNETFSLFFLDLPNSITGLDTPNSKFGPNTFYHDQFSSLYAWRNIGTSDYNAMQVTYNVHFASNLQAQFNYTFSKSLDEASAAEREGPYEGTGGTGNDLNGGGIVINSWDPLALRGPSDFNAKHNINANWVYRLPFGHGQRWAGGAGTMLNELVGGWRISGLFRWSSGFPITVDNGPQWSTNWNIEGDAEPVGPGLPAKESHKDAANAFIFADPGAALNDFRPDWPGESGVRNNVTGDGLFDIDTGVSKDFALGESKRLEFTWQTFNLTNSVRYDVRTAQPSISYGPGQFGKYNSTLTTPRFMQFALRFVF
jgi:Carboxypeptidase regulatory-like domain/TonB-dependent Receptor Plug Domain